MPPRRPTDPQGRGGGAKSPGTPKAVPSSNAVAEHKAQRLQDAAAKLEAATKELEAATERAAARRIMLPSGEWIILPRSAHDGDLIVMPRPDGRAFRLVDGAAVQLTDG